MVGGSLQKLEEVNWIMSNFEKNLEQALINAKRLTDKILIDGKLVSAQSKNKIPVLNPSTGENIGSVKLVPNSIIVIGNESNGVSKNIKEKLKNTIRIPGNGKAESLNVSVATGIILNELEKLTLKSK